MLQPVFAGFSILSPSWLWIVMPACSRLVAAGRLGPVGAAAAAGAPGPALAVSDRRGVRAGQLHRVRLRQPDPAGARHGPAHQSRARHRAAGQDGERCGRTTGRPTPHIGYRSDVIEVVEQYLYRPLRRPFLSLVRLAQRLQSGRLDAYLAYMLITLIALLAVVTAVR